VHDFGQAVFLSGRESQILMTDEMSNGQTSGSVWTRQQGLTLAALISCLSIYGITISLFTPLLSLILEGRGVSTTVIGTLAMTAPVGVMIGSFVVPKIMRRLEGRNLLVVGVVIELALIYALMATESLIAWFIIRFLGGLTGAVLFVVTETWMIEIAPKPHRGRVMGLYNTTLALSFALGPLMLSYTGVSDLTPFVAGMVLMALAGLPLFFSDNTALYAFKQNDIFCNNPTGCSNIPPASGKAFHWSHIKANSRTAGIAPPSAAEAQASIKLPGR